MKQTRDADYWISRLREDGKKLDDFTKLRLIRELLIHRDHLEPEDADLFLAPEEELNNPEGIAKYATIERKIAKEYSKEHTTIWNERELFLKGIRNCLRGFYTDSEIDEIATYMPGQQGAGCFTIFLAGDHYGFRRIRNTYLPEITDLISINTETGSSQDLTEHLFAEGPEDAVSRIERVLGIK